MTTWRGEGHRGLAFELGGAAWCTWLVDATAGCRQASDSCAAACWHRLSPPPPLRPAGAPGGSGPAWSARTPPAWAARRQRWRPACRWCPTRAPRWRGPPGARAVGEQSVLGAVGPVHQERAAAPSLQLLQSMVTGQPQRKACNRQKASGSSGQAGRQQPASRQGAAAPETRHCSPRATPCRGRAPHRSAGARARTRCEQRHRRVVGCVTICRTRNTSLSTATTPSAPHGSRRRRRRRRALSAARHASDRGALATGGFGGAART